MKVLSQTQNRIKFLIETNKIDEIYSAYDYAEKHFQHFRMEWDYSSWKKRGKNVLIAKKAKLRKCEICGNMDICDFEYENGEKVYKICALCWLNLNS